MRHTLTAARSDKHQVRPATDHFRRLVKEACPNHAYPIRHKLKDCGMMRSFTPSCPLPGVRSSMKTQVEVIRRLSPGKNVVMMVYGGRPPTREAPLV
jgi:hypothetical protein